MTVEQCFILAKAIRNESIKSISLEITRTLVSNSRLKTQIKSKPGYLRYFFGGNVSRDVIEEDIQRLTAYYRNLGYFQARIARELIYDDSGRWLTINFIIDEGPRYVVRDLSIVGNTIFNKELIQEKLKLALWRLFQLGQNEDPTSAY